MGLTVRIIVNTHGTWTIFPPRRVKRATGADARHPRVRRGHAAGPDGEPFGLCLRPVVSRRRQILAEVTPSEWGRLQLNVLHTPGHTEGEYACWAGAMCFPGDTLFAGLGRAE